MTFSIYKLIVVIKLDFTMLSFMAQKFNEVCNASNIAKRH